MGFHHLDQLSRVESPITRRSPTVRLLGTVLVAVGAAVLPTGAWIQMAALALLVVVAATLARIRPRAFLTRILPPLGFVLLASVAVLFLAPGSVMASFGPFRVTDTGLVRFGSVAGRAGVALGAAVVLVTTTSFPEILEAFRRLRLPAVVTTSLGLAYRYLYLLTDEVARMRRAAASRNAAAGSASRRRLMIGVSAAALQRSFARSERVYQAMLGRGYTGEFRPLRSMAGSGHPVLEVGALAAVVLLVVVSAVL